MSPASDHERASLAIVLWCSTLAMPAAAFEAQGPTPPPSTGHHPAANVSAPVGPEAGSWSIQGVVQGLSRPLVRVQDDGGTPSEDCLVCTVFGVTAAGQVALGDRLALGLAAPIYPWVSGAQESAPALGDVSLWAPVTLLRREGGGVALRPFVTLPTGSSKRFLGDGGFGGGLLASGGVSVGPVQLVGELGVDLAQRDVTGPVELQNGLGAWIDVGPSLALGPELTGRLDLGANAFPSVQELAMGGRWSASDRVSLRASAGRGLSDVPGASAFRGHLSVQFSPSAAVVADPVLVASDDTVDYVFHDSMGRPLREVDVVLRGNVVGTSDHQGVAALPRALRWRDGPLGRSPGYQLTPLPDPGPDAERVEVELDWQPVPVQVRVVDGTGALLDADIELTGDSVISPPMRDELGSFTYDVPVGVWTLTTGAAGYSPQQRTVVIPGGRTEPMRVDAVLTRSADGVGSLVVTVTDPDGDPVEGALVRLGDDIFGTTGSGGDLSVAQLTERVSELEVSAAAFEVQAPRPVAVRGDAARPVVMLTHLPGSVEVRVTGPDGLPTSALVDVASDSASLRPVRTGNDGRHVWVLGEGSWTIGVTSPGLGGQRRRIVVDHSERSLQRVDVQLAQELGPARLFVRALDANGRVVPGAEVRIDERVLGRTGSDGSLSVDGLPVGETTLHIEAPRVRPYEQALRLTAARRDVDALLEWLPGTLQVRALGPQGMPVSGEIRATDGTQTVRGAFDIDGRWVDRLPPGEWQVLASVEELGLQTRSMVVEPDKTSLLTIDFRLAEVAGKGGLSLTLLRPDGSPVEGAEVFLDDQTLGTTGTGGALTVSSLAAGSHTLRATAKGHEPVEALVRLGSGELEETITMPWGEGVVAVRVRQGEEPVNDAVLRLSGPRPIEPVGTDAEGEARVALVPGSWTLLVSSVSAGLHQEQIEVPTGGEPTSLTIAMKQVGTGTMLVRVFDEDGAPVPGARVMLRPGPTEITSTGGAALLTSLVPGPAQLDVDVPEPLVDQRVPVEVGRGSEQVSVEVLFPRSPVELTTVDDTGQGIAADVLIQGAGLLPVQYTDREGRIALDLRPGAWRAWGRSGLLEGAAAFDVALQASANVEVVLESSTIAMDGGRFRFDESVLFDVGRSELKAEALPEVDALAERLHSDPTIVQAEVQGHTDDTGTLAINMALSQARAWTVLQALIDRGVPRERLRARGFGSLRPTIAGTDDAARAANRRVDVVVTEKAAR